MALAAIRVKKCCDVDVGSLGRNALWALGKYHRFVLSLRL
jgi:hypothetical protein